MDDYKKYFENKTILVTGGTGSFGEVVVKRLLSFSPKQIIVFSRDEKKQFDMANKFSDERVRFVIGDVRDASRVTYIMKGIDLVFHAAALKQVPNCEFFPMEALLTNSVGAYNVVSAAVHHDVERVVVLSTDKAVYPINVMGITKALMERIMIAAAREKRSKTVLCGTRYGNVMYTRGSVIPYFIDLMKAGKPLTVTNKDMTRFMMSVEESVDLVLYALTDGQDGVIYVKKAPATTIGNLAQALVEIFSYSGGIKEIGTRPGEKQYEVLISREEAVRTEDKGDYYKVNSEVPNMDMKQYYYKGDGHASALPAEGYTSENTKRLDIEEIKNLLLSLPEIQAELKVFKK